MKESKVRNPSSKVKPKLTQSRLKELLDYDPETGIFIWRIYRNGNVKAGSIAGTKNHDGYMRISIDYKTYGISRLAFLWMKGYFPEHDVDHINRVKDDNKWDNLRHVTTQCNIRNSPIRNTNSSGVNGVGWHKPTKKWRSRIRANNETIHLGLFPTLREAAKARWDAEVRYGYPNCNTTSSAYQFLTSTLSTR